MESKVRTIKASGNEEGRDKVVDRTQASIVTDMIRRDIIAGIFPPGSKLLLRELSARYDVGTIPLREALSRLAMSGFVRALDQRGFQVAQASEEELLDIIRVRMIIETEALKDAMAHGDLAWEGNIMATYHQLTRIPMSNPKLPGKLNPEWEIAHDKFHSAILAACKSPWLLRLASLLRTHSGRYRYLSVRYMESGDRDVPAEHAALIKAILDHDLRTSTNLLNEHFNTTARLTIEKSKVKLLPKKGSRSSAIRTTTK